MSVWQGRLRASVWAMGLLALGACSAPATRGGGGPCRSLSDCKPGLACYEGKCTRNLRGLASQGDAPPFTTFVDAAAEMPDAGMSSDATVPNDAATANDASPSNDAAASNDAAVATDGG